MGKAPKAKNNPYKEGTAKRKYVTRSSAINYLQLSLPAFRKMCILKGIFPYVVEKKDAKKASYLRRGSSATYYLMKDLKYMAKDPLIKTIRDKTIYRRKLEKAKARKNFKKMYRVVETLKPDWNIDHVVKERYPTFRQALEDMDDALTLLGTFATLPPQKNMFMEETKLCADIVRQFQLYTIHTRALKKVFLAVQGVYYQVEIEGVPITWVMPYQFTTQPERDVDLTVMKTFVDLWSALGKFVVFKLFHDRNMTYPPTFVDDGLGMMVAKPQRLPQMLPPMSKKLATTQRRAGEEEAQEAVDAVLAGKAQLFEEDEDEDMADAMGEDEEMVEINDDEDADEEEEEEEGENADEEAPEVFEAGGTSGASAKKMADAKKHLFDNYVMFISRECPRYAMEFAIMACGGRVGSDAPYSPFKRQHTFITHEIVDRPAVLDPVPGRKYVQPQWVFDSINAGIILPEERYRVGTILPPHLSPFVDWSKESYVPQYAKDVERMVCEAFGLPIPESVLEAPVLAEEDELAAEEEQYMKELEAEKKGVDYAAFNKAESEKQKTYVPSAAAKKEKETVELQEQMLAGKKKSIYKRLREGEKKVQHRTTRMRRKGERLEAHKAEAEDRQAKRVEKAEKQMVAAEARNQEKAARIEEHAQKKRKQAKTN